MSKVNPAKFYQFYWGDAKLPVCVHRGACFDQSEVKDALAEIPLDAAPPKDMFVGLLRDEKFSRALFKVDGKTEEVRTPVYEGIHPILQKVAEFLAVRFPKQKS